MLAAKKIRAVLVMNTRFRFLFRKMLFQFLILCLTAAVFALIGTMQPQAAGSLDLLGSQKDYTAVLYDNTNGLPTSETNAIVQSENGYIWMGGYSGLVRYDGNMFYRYDSSTGIATVRCLYIDTKGRLWIGTNDDGAAMLQNEKFTFFNKGKGLASSSIRSIIEDDHQNIIVATTMGITVIDSKNEVHSIDEAQINKKYIKRLTKAADGTIYGAEMEGGFFAYKDGRILAFYDPDKTGLGPIDCVYPDPDQKNVVYLGSRKYGVIRWDLTKPATEAKKYSVEPQNTINNVCKIDGKLWICCDNGVGYFDGYMRYTPVPDLPMFNSVDNVMKDYEGNLWFTSSRQGVMKIVENQFKDISKQVKMDSMVVNATCRYKEMIYVGSDSGLFIINGDEALVENKLTELIGESRVRCIIRDKKNILWFCTYSDYGLISYNPETEDIQYYNEDKGIASNRVRMLKELSDGRLAVSTSKGVVILKDGKVVDWYSDENGISNTEILSIEEATDGRLYFGSDGDGIYVVDGNRISRVGKEDGLTSEVIMRIKKDPKEDLYWLITSNSVSFMRNEKVTAVKNFPYSNNFDLYFDSSENAWVTSSSGIYVVKRKELLANKEIDYVQYDIHSGLPCVSTANSYCQLDEDGSLYMSCSAGVCKVNINKAAVDNSKIKLGIPSLMADDQYIGIDNKTEVHIPSDCKRLNISANAFTYSLNNPHISYYLEGFDDDPIQMTKKDLGVISYTNLRGGTYKFHFSVMNTMTGKEEKSVVVTIIKDKALYEEVWVRYVLVALIVCLLSLTFLFIYKRKTNALLRKQKEHQSLINEMAMAFSRCVESKDEYTNGHAARVAKYSRMFAKKLGKSEDEVDRIYNIALLHDIGKISIPDSILNKPGRLTDEEYAIMKTHPQKGYEILKDITIAPDLALGARYHHERIDGKGYPKGLKGDEIPEIAQIIAVADTFDAMYSTRPYRKKMKLEDVAAEIKRCAGTQLSQKVADVFLELVDEGVFDNDETK